VAEPPSVVSVERKGSRLGVAGFVCGLVGALIALIPLFFFMGWILGVLGIVFGAVGWRNAWRDAGRGGKRLSIAALVLGVVAVALGVFGFTMLENWFQ
jgi:hypothetical protein